MTDKPTGQPDMIAQVGAMLSRMASGAYAVIPGPKVSHENSDDHTIVLASAILAVAAELRELGNTLSAIDDKLPAAWTRS